MYFTRVNSVVGFLVKVTLHDFWRAFQNYLQIAQLGEKLEGVGDRDAHNRAEKVFDKIKNPLDVCILPRTQGSTSKKDRRFIENRI